MHVQVEQVGFAERLTCDAPGGTRVFEAIDNGGECERAVTLQPNGRGVVEVYGTKSAAGFTPGKPT